MLKHQFHQVLTTAPDILDAIVHFPCQVLEGRLLNCICKSLNIWVGLFGERGRNEVSEMTVFSVMNVRA